jgi:hypothetical protein
MAHSEAHERFVVEVPIVYRLRLSESSAAFHSKIGNDESWQLSRYIEAFTGQWSELHNDTSPEGFERVMAAVHALDVSKRLVTWLLAVQGVSRDLQTHVHLRSADVPEAASDPLSRRVLDKLVREVSHQLAYNDANPRGLVRATGVPELAWAPSPYDFFMSYKHMLHREQAVELARALKKRGFRCFLDVDDLPADVVATALFDGLRSALAAARCCIFFETVAHSVAGEQLTGGQTASSVHAFELRHATNILFVRLSPAAVYTRSGPVMTGWRTTDELAEVLADQLGFDDSSARAADPRLDDVLEKVDEIVEEGLGFKVKVAPLAALAVAAPGQLNLGNMQSVPAMGDDVLRTLLRYDIETSLTLEEAGLPPLAYSGATAAWPDGRWARPRASVVTAWPSDVVARVNDRVRRTGWFDEAALALGLIGAGKDPASYSGRALRRALSGLPSPPGEPSEQHVLEVIARASDVLDRSAAGPRHSWVLTIIDNDPALVPVSWSGPYRLDSQLGAGLYVAARIDPWLLPPELMDQHRDTMRKAMQGEAGARDDLRRLVPELAVTLTTPGRQLSIVDLSPAGDGAVFLAGSGPFDNDVLRTMLPPGVDRLVRKAWVSGFGVGGDEHARLLPDRLALWDLLARAGEHLRCHALDPAQVPWRLGSVAPTSTATSPGSLWPPGR